MARVESLVDVEVQQAMLSMPFRKFEQRRYLKYDRDLAFVRFDPSLWRQLTPQDKQSVRATCEQSIVKYYERFAQT
jgi:hypothetical protein